MGVGKLALSCALGGSDLNRALFDGSVTVQGADLRCLSLSSPERHWRMFRHREFDIAEVSFGAFLAIHDRRPGEFVAVPAFPHRRFRHSYVFTAYDRPELRAEDLSGKRIGIRTWTNTAGVWTRGILQDRHSIDLSSVQWVMQDADTAGSENLPPGFAIEPVALGETVVDLASRGEVDALIYPEIPDVLDTPGGLRRIFADAAAEEVRYFEETGLFPIMHTVALRGELVEQNPWLPYEVLRAFRAAKDKAMAEVENPRNIALVWARDTYERQRAVMGADPWAYEVGSSTPAIETLIRYASEQGIVATMPDVEDLFHPSCLSEPPSYVRR